MVTFGSTEFYAVTLSAIFDRTSADGFLLCYSMKENDDVCQAVYRAIVSPCVGAVRLGVLCVSLSLTHDIA